MKNEQGLLFDELAESEDDWCLDSVIDSQLKRVNQISNFFPTVPMQKKLVVAQYDLMEKVHDGANCPCCGRHTKVYERPLNATMAMGIYWLVTASQCVEGVFSWVDVPARAPKEILRSNQYQSLRWWGLIERPCETEIKGSRLKKTGLWRPTLKGVRFVRGEIQVPRKAVTLFGEVVGYSEEKIGIRGALEEMFDYAQAMSSVSDYTPVVTTK